MRIPADTSPDAYAVQIEAYRRMGGTGRVQAMFGLIQMTRDAARAGIRRRHPEYDEGAVTRALARLLYGDDLVREAWPNHELLAP